MSILALTLICFRLAFVISVTIGASFLSLDQMLFGFIRSVQSDNANVPAMFMALVLFSLNVFRRKGQRSNMFMYHIIISVIFKVKLFADCNRRDTLASFLDRH